MPFTKQTLTDCHQSLADRHDKGVIPTSSVTLSNYTRELNRGVLYCASKLRYHKETTLTTVSGRIELPDDFMVINSVCDSGDMPLLMADSDGFHFGQVFWITGDQLNGFYLNTTEDKTYTVDYAFRPAPMVTGTDECIIPDIEAPVAFAYAKIRKRESDPFEDADAAFQECDALIAEINSQNSINDNSIGFTVI
jgi:hypothetical protein